MASRLGRRPNSGQPVLSNGKAKMTSFILACSATLVRTLVNFGLKCFRGEMQPGEGSAPPSAFVTAPGGSRGSDVVPAVDAHAAAATAAAAATNPGVPQTPAAEARTILLSVALGIGAAAAQRQLAFDSKRGSASPRSRGSSVARQVGVDWSGAATPWEQIETKSLGDIEFGNVHGVYTALSVALFLYQGVRIALHQAPSEPEVWLTTAVYLPWSYFCWRDTAKLEGHYQVTFYASCGWAITSLASLHSVFYQTSAPEYAFGVLVFGNLIFASACIYFYGYHWTRMWRHFTQNRFRPLWIPGLVGLMALHALTPLDFAKRIDDMGWWGVVCQIYPDEQWWVADVRCIELFVTAAALWLILLHIQGVFTGMKNAVVVVFCTIFLPLAVMVLESSWLRASAWQHYFMVGPKYW